MLKKFKHNLSHSNFYNWPTTCCQLILWDKYLWTPNTISLALNKLNCFIVCQRYIHILNRMLELAWPKKIKSILEQQYMFSVLYCQYHACWCSGDFRSQSISRHGILSQSQNIPSPASQYQNNVLWKYFGFTINSIEYYSIGYSDKLYDRSLIIFPYK